MPDIKLSEYIKHTRHFDGLGMGDQDLEQRAKALEAKANRYHSALAVIYANPHEPDAAQLAENALYDVEDTDAGNNR